MSFSRMKNATDHVARLPDCPDAASGYTPQALKEVFDRGATEIKEYINGVLLKELEANGAGASAAERLGSAYVKGLEGSTVYRQICSLKEGMERAERKAEGAILGQIPDGSLGKSKLNAELLEELGLHRLPSLGHAAFTAEGAYLFFAPVTGRYRIRAVGAGGGGTLCCEGSPTGSFDCTGGPSGAYGEVNLHLEQGAQLSVFVGKGGVPADFRQGQTLSSEEYVGDYLANARYSSPGGDTQVYVNNETYLVAKGGDGMVEGTKARLYGSWEAPAVTQSGRRCAAEGAKLLRQGADSALGQGGNREENAGMGAGGDGGRLYLGEDGDCEIRELPACGGDGAVLIDYVGGEA